MSIIKARTWQPAPADQAVDSIVASLENMEGAAEELVHAYGHNVHIHITDVVMRTLLARLSDARTKQPTFNQLLRLLYGRLLDKVINRHFPLVGVEVPTPMAKTEGRRGHWVGTVISDSHPVVIVDIARAGTVPAEEVFATLSGLMDPDQVRKDLIVMARKTDESHQVVGTDCAGSKIGGPIHKAIVLLTDPMGATGFSMRDVLKHYQNEVAGQSLITVLMNLIITPEYIELITNEFPDVIIHAVRVDRAFSSARALGFIPGQMVSEESGLTDIQYIAPGAGGVGERETNSWV
jgi:uracil phosphoribosyltransferase